MTGGTVQLPDFSYDQTDEEMPHDAYFGAKVIKCSNCGSGLFEVASGDYATLVRCAECKATTCVHYG